MRIIQNIKSNPFEWISVFVLFIFFFPIIFIPDTARYLTHDNLDSNVVWYKCLAESGLMFKQGTLDFILGGIPRDCFPSEWSIDRLLYHIFNPQTAYGINYILLHSIAFIGMRLFLRRYVTKNKAIFNLVALSFAMLPFWVSGGITVAGLPLLAYSFFNIFKNNASYFDWIIFLLFPFYSSIVFGNAFSFPFFFLLWILGVLMKRWRFNLVHILPFIFLLISTVFIEKRFLSLLISGFESNRILDYPTVEQFMNMKGIIGTSVRAFVFGHYHFHSLSGLIAISSLIIVIYLIFKGKIKSVSTPLTLMLVIASFAFITIFLNNYDLKSLFGDNFPKVSLRLWVWFPFLWFTIFALLLDLLRNERKLILTNALLYSQVLFVLLLIYPKDYFGSRYAENMLANTFIYSSNNEQSRWDDYYMANELKTVKDFIPDITSQKVVRVGVSPEVLQYNGLKTFEGYYSFYPAQILKQIREIDVLERQKVGSNFYQSANRGYLYYSNKKPHDKPDWNWDLLRKNNVKYLISDKEIQGFAPYQLVYSDGLRVYRVFE